MSTRFRGWLRLVLFSVGIALLAYSAWVVLDARQFQQRENQVLDRLLREKPSSSLTLHTPATIPPVPADQSPERIGSLIGRIEIPRLGLSEVIVEGADAKTLRRAVGHMPQTPMPGQTGNTAITGHRDTFFRPLRKIHQDDLITLTTLQGQFLYRVVSTRIVQPDDVAVLDPGGGESLTLITCYPFYFVGAAPQRFIVRADRVLQTALAR
jgi:sortase A